MAEFDALEDTLHYRNTKRVPGRFINRVCMCDEPGPPLFDPEKRPAAIMCCSRCLKPYRWNIRHCTNGGCRKWFIKDFRRKDFDCIKHTKCYECTQGCDNCECKKETSKRVDFGPLGFNPPEVSQDEMDAAFEMPSVFD